MSAPHAAPGKSPLLDASIDSTFSDSLQRLPKLSYRRDIDGMRGIAVMTVIAYHSGLAAMSGGFVGVDVFFVISGYLIGSIVLSEVLEGRFRFSEFYARRSRRILPALFLVVVCSLVGALLLFSPLELKQFAGAGSATILAISNIYFWLSTNYFSPSAEFNPLLMTWSLGVEEQFYLLLPVALVIAAKFFRGSLSRIALVIFVIAAISIGASAFLTARHPTAAFFLLPTRAWELSAGLLLAIMELSRKRRFLSSSRLNRNAVGLIGLGVILGSAWFLNGTASYPGILAGLPVLGTTLLIAARDSFVNSRVLTFAPLVFIGKISYSWYLWHWPLLAFARNAADQPLSSGAALTIVLVSFCLSVLSWKYIEQPFRQQKASTSATLRSYFGAAAVIASVLIALNLSAGFPARFSPTLSLIERNSLYLSQDRCLVSYGARAPNLEPTCIGGTKDRRLALLGDSHAAALGGAIREMADERGYEVMQLTKSACPPLIDVTRRMPLRPMLEDECAEFNKRSFKLVIADPTVKVVLLAGYWAAPFVEQGQGSRFALVTERDRDVTESKSRENLASGLVATVRALEEAHKRVVLVLDPPIYDFNPFRHIEQQYIPARRMLARFIGASAPSVGRNVAASSEAASEGMMPLNNIDRLKAAFPDLQVLNLHSALCQENSCRFADSAGSYYLDDQHLSFLGASKALRASGFMSLLVEASSSIQKEAL
jgi:peptidoglycan/LPS O-acetylase OafA/YrhL